MTPGPFRVCAVVPVFDHGATVAGVALGAARHVETVIVVDDGSRDGGGDAAKSAAAEEPAGRGVEVLRFAANRGKGTALAAGLRRAQELGFTHAVTIDADGQHTPDDIPRLVEAARSAPDAVVIGARDLSAAQVPGGSRFGRWMSNFWVLRTTGNDVPDTQSGFRSYPVAAVLALPLRCARYDFEVEVLVLGAWSGLPLRSVPIRVHYPERSERISHFRVLGDNVRISWTYTRLAMRRLLPFGGAGPPRPSVGDAGAPPPRTRLRDVPAAIRRLAREGTRPAELALAVAVGVLLGASPLWGLHSVLAVWFSLRWHLNGVATFLGSNVSMPLVAPYLVFVSVQCGHLLLHGRWADVDPRTLGPESIPDFLADYLVGSMPVAAVLAAIAGTATYLAARAFGGGRS